jgi:hypothetical protein
MRKQSALGVASALMFGSLLERAISCEQVLEGRRLKAFQEAVDRALKALAYRFPENKGFSVKLKHKNLPAFAPAYYTGTLDCIEVRRGWTFGLDALLDATAKAARDIKLVVVRASRLQSLVGTVSMLVFWVAVCTGLAIVAGGLVFHRDWLWESLLEVRAAHGARIALLLGVLAPCLILVLVVGLSGLLACLIKVILSFLLWAFLCASGKGAPRQELQEVREAIGGEIQHWTDQLASMEGAAGPFPTELEDRAMSTSTSSAMDYTSRGLSGEYSCIMTGAVLKVVHCACCGVVYIYQLKRLVRGEGYSFLSLDNEGATARAASKAEAELHDTLERSVDPVPCPACGWYQQNMLLKARKEHRSGMLYTGLYVTIGLIPVAIIGAMINGGIERNGDAVIPWPVFLGGLSFWLMLGVGLMVTKFILAATYDPNRQDVETRKQIGRARAMLREELEKMIPAQQNDKAKKSEEA